MFGGVRVEDGVVCGAVCYDEEAVLTMCGGVGCREESRWILSSVRLPWPIFHLYLRKRPLWMGCCR